MPKSMPKSIEFKDFDSLGDFFTKMNDDAPYLTSEVPSPRSAQSTPRSIASTAYYPAGFQVLTGGRQHAASNALIIIYFIYTNNI